MAWSGMKWHSKIMKWHEVALRGIGRIRVTLAEIAVQFKNRCKITYLAQKYTKKNKKWQKKYQLMVFYWVKIGLVAIWPILTHFSLFLGIGDITKKNFFLGKTPKKSLLGQKHPFWGQKWLFLTPKWVFWPKIGVFDPKNTLFSLKNRLF